MRTLVLILFLVAAVLSAYGQAGGSDFFVAVHELDAAPEAIQDQATALIEANDYFDTAAPVGDPTVLLPGDMQLRIDGAPFTLYLQPMNRHTEVRLESRRLDLKPEVKKKAEAFLQEIAQSIVTSHG